MEKEEWRNISGFTGYQISSKCRCRSFKKKNGHGFDEIPHILTPDIDPYGYEIYCLRKDNKTRRRAAHRLIYEAFVGKIPDGAQIDHIDCNKRNNNLSNLQVVTLTENVQRSWRNGQHYRGEDHPLAKLSNEDVRRIRECPQDTQKYWQLAEELQVSIATIYQIRRRYSWKHIA